MILPNTLKHMKVEESREQKSLDPDELLNTEDKIKRQRRKNHEKWMKDKAQISIRIPIEFKAQIDCHTDSRGEKLSNFVVRAIKETMERDRQQEST